MNQARRVTHAPRRLGGFTISVLGAHQTAETALLQSHKATANPVPRRGSDWVKLLIDLRL